MGACLLRHSNTKVHTYLTLIRPFIIRPFLISPFLIRTFLI